MKYITSQAVRNTSPVFSTSTNTCTCSPRKVCKVCNLISITRSALISQGYHAVIPPVGNQLTYRNFQNPDFSCTDGSKMLAIFERELGFPIVLEDEEANHYFKTQLPAYAKDRHNQYQIVQSWFYGRGSESFLFEHGEAVYSALTNLKHDNHYKCTVPVTSPKAFAKACKKLAKKGVNVFEVVEVINQLIHQKYITFENALAQFAEYLSSEGAVIASRPN